MDADNTMTAEQVAAMIDLKVNQIDLQRIEMEAGMAHRAYMEMQTVLSAARMDVMRAELRWKEVSGA